MKRAWGNTIKSESNEEMIFLEIDVERTAKHKFSRKSQKQILF